MVSKQAQFNMTLGDPVTERKFVSSYPHNKATEHTNKPILL